MSGSSVLAIYVEPAPYITGLVRELRLAWKDRLDVLYITPRLTQDWGQESQGDPRAVLPAQRWKAVAEIRERLRSGAYDLLHLAGWGHPVLLGAMMAARIEGLPVTMESDTPLPRREALWRRLAKRALYPMLFSLPRRFLPAGTRQAAYLKAYGVKNDRVRAAHMTVDVQALSGFVAKERANARACLREKCGIAGDTILFLYLGRLESFKGLQDLFDAFLNLRSRRKDIALLLAGSGSLESFVRETSAALRAVHFLGHLTGPDVWRAYCASDVFVLPSRREPWGLVVNEAMACGLPVIVSDAAGCIDDLVNAETGLTFPAGDAARLASLMEELADDGGMRQRLGSNARRLISTWTLARESRCVADAWNEVLS